MLLTCAFLKQNSVISLEEWVLVLKLFTAATRKLRVNVPVTCRVYFRKGLTQENVTYCYTKQEVADQTCNPTQSQYTDIRPSSHGHRTNRTMLGVWQVGT